MTLGRVWQRRKACLALLASIPLLFSRCTAGPACAQESGSPPPSFEAKPWKEADQLFRTDPRWLGGDGAYSIDLGRGRVLWLFGDSFIADRPGVKRSASHMVHNSIAIQTGYDPSKASLKFYWRIRNGKPAEFASDRGDAWLWPSDGVRLGNKLLLFFTKVRADSRKDSLGFKNFGWTAFLVDNPDATPSAWVLHRLRALRNPWGVIVGAATLHAHGFVYVFGYSEPGHDAYLLRLPASAAGAGDLSSPEWWCGPHRRWIQQQKIGRAPVPVISGSATEFSVQQDSRLKEFLEVQSVEFGASDIAIRRAGRLEGSWSQPMKIYRPPESNRPDALVYAGKGHPELSGADVIITYVANSSSDETLATDMGIYYPRFVRLDFRPR